MKLAAAIAGLAALNILLGFASNWYTLTAIGPGPETDALYAGMVVPNFLLAIFIGSFGSVMVPLLATEKTETINKEAWSFFQGIALLYCGLAALLWVSASWWGPLTAPGFDAAAKTSFISLIRTHLFSMVGNALTLVLVGVYHSRQKFLVLEVSAMISTTTGLGFLLWGLPRFGVIAAIWATAIKLFLQVLILTPGLGSYKTPDWGSRTFKEAFRRMRPLALGNAYSKTDQLVDTYLASLTPAGGLSLLHLARQIYSSGQLILDKAITNPAAPLLAQAASRGEWRSYSRISVNRTGWMLTLTAAAFLGVIFMGKPALTLLFGHGRFEESSLILLWFLLIALAGFWMGGPAGRIVASSFYAKGNTTTPTKLQVITSTFGIFLKLGGFYLWGVLGIAIGTSIYYFFHLALLRYILTVRLKKRISGG